MGISSLPAPSEGVLTLLLVNTALSISILKEIVRSLLHVVGIHRGGSPEDDFDEDEGTRLGGAGDSFSEFFRTSVKPVRFGSDREGRAVDCRVCLTRFEPDSMVNRLPCGHLFHEGCLEKWLNYHHVTCPLCRTHLLPLDNSTSPAWC